MRMRNRFSKWSRHSSGMVCLLAACGLMYGCKDEYLLDEEKPSWLSSSIYESLEKGYVDSNGEKATFNTYLRLLADKDVQPANARPLIEVLNRTGSKTVFVANDEAWKKFFEANAALPESNPWHNATEYDKLSVAQKKLLIHTSMLNNAIVMENLASSDASAGGKPVRGEYMRRFTDVQTTDSITYMTPEMIPYSYNPTDKDFWWRFRAENGGKGLHIVKDSTLSMMLHFTSEHMAKATVNDDDFAKFMGRERITSDVHIYDALLLEKDGVCENGYVNITEKPLVPLANMAEVIRSNGKTNIFGHMLDRYSAPYYSDAITRACRILYPEKFGDTDSVFTMRYFSENSFGHLPNHTQPDGNTFAGDANGEVSLKFDPGWNEYYDEVDAEKDMAAMFIPSDKALWDYFTKGGGLQLIETYDVNYVPGQNYDSEDDLYRAIDQIPLSTLQGLINVIMLRSFTGSVPSKMTKLRDDAQEQLFYPEDVEMIDTCLLACNGAVYIMDDIYGPADYTSVTSPAYISKTNNVIKWAIYNGSSGTDYMGLNYYAYLKAMQSEFTFFLPSDEALQYYYDPTSFESNTPRLIQFSYKGGGSGFPIQTKCFDYNPETGEIGKALVGSGAALQQQEITNRLKDILESHTIVHDGTNPINGEDEYFLTKNGNAVKVIRGEDHQIISIKGGLQLENERQQMAGANPGTLENKVTKPFDKLKNGQTYIIDSPVTPTYRSVYSILTQDEGWENSSAEQWEQDCPYAEFYKLCETNTAIVRACGLVDEKNLTVNEQKSALKKYQIFVDLNGLDDNIQFFNNYRYTAFIPSNEAVKDAIAKGLPTWEELELDNDTLELHVNALDSLKDVMKDVDYVWQEQDSLNRDSLQILASADSMKLQAKITYLTNFIRYHFADNSVFADKTALPEFEMVTSSYDKELGLFCKLYVDRQGEGVLRVRDGQEGSQMMTTIGEKNVLARDIECSVKPVGRPMATSGTKITLDASSACVIHSIPGILNHTALNADGTHNVWQNKETAKKYLKRYAITNDKFVNTHSHE